MTPPPRASSSLVFKVSRWSVVTRAEAAYWALAWFSVLARLCTEERTG